jgi:hypothetical protein
VVLSFLTSCLTWRNCRSRRIIVFGTYHGESVMILRTLDWSLSRILTPFPTAVHRKSIWVLGSPYTRAACFPGTISISAQGSSTVFVVVGPGGAMRYIRLLYVTKLHIPVYLSIKLHLCFKNVLENRNFVNCKTKENTFQIILITV